MPVGVSAYVPLATKTLTATATSVTFSSISQAYRDLVLVADPTPTATTSYMALILNADTGSNYPRVLMTGNGSTATSSASTLTNIDLNVVLASGQRQNVVVNLMDYSATDKHKTILTRSNNSAFEVTAIASRWANTAAITTIKVDSFSTWAAGSTFTLYGINS